MDSTQILNNWAVKPSGTAISGTALLLMAAALGMTSGVAMDSTPSIQTGKSTFAQSWQGTYTKPETSVFWMPSVGEAPLQNILKFSAVREFLNMTPQVNPLTIQTLHDSLKRFFPSADITFEKYLDYDTGRAGLRFSVDTSMEDADEVYSREVAFFDEIQNQPTLLSALTHSIISIY